MISNIDKKFIEVKNSLKEKFIKVDFESDFLEFNDIELEILILTLSDIYIFDINNDLKLIKNVRKAINRGLKKYKELNPQLIRRPLLSFSFNFEKLEHNKILLDIETIIKSKYKVDIIEFHFNNCSEINIDKFIDKLTNFDFPFICSLSFTRKRLSNSAIIKTINRFNENISKNLIIEIDNFFNKGSNNDLDNALQIISTADIINKELRRKEMKFKRMPLILSSDIDSSIFNLAKQCNVEFNGLNIKHSVLQSLKKVKDSKLLSFDKSFSKYLSNSIIINS